MNTATQVQLPVAKAPQDVRVYDRDLLAVMRSVNAMCVEGVEFRYAELEARIRMQMAMRKMGPETSHQTPEWYASRIVENLRYSKYAFVMNGKVQILQAIRPLRDYIAHAPKEEWRSSALYDYFEGFDA